MIERFKKWKIKEKIDRHINGQLTKEDVDELWAELIQDGYHLDYLKTAANLKDMLVREREQEQSGTSSLKHNSGYSYRNGPEP